MDSDSESQDSDDGRRFRFEATRKDNVQLDAKMKKLSTLKSQQESCYNNIKHKNKKDKFKRNYNREHKHSKELNNDNRDSKYSTKYSKNEIKNSKRENNKDYKNLKDISLDTKSIPLSSKHKTKETKKHKSQNRNEYLNYKSQERCHNRNENDKSQNGKHKNKCHEKYNKHHTCDRNRDKSNQSCKMRSEDCKFREEFEKYNIHKKISMKEDEKKFLSKNIKEDNCNNESLTKREIEKVESQEYNELNLSEFNILSDENITDISNVKNKNLLLQLHDKNSKKRYFNNEHNDSSKKHVIEMETMDKLPKVNARKNDLFYGSSNNNSGTVSDILLNTSAILMESRKNIIDLNNREIICTSLEENNMYITEPTSLHLNNCNSVKITDINEKITTYGPALPPQLKTDLSNNIESNKDFIGPCLPKNDAQNINEKIEKETVNNISQDNIMEEDVSYLDIVFGPALPPHLLKQKYNDDMNTKIIGPILPNSAMLFHNHEINQIESEDEDGIGPLPVNHPALENNFVYKQLEQRAQQIKNEQKDEDYSILNQREEWMTELPPSQINNLGLTSRKFRMRAGPDMSDRSCWTDTPAKKAEKRKREEEKLYNDRTLITDLSIENETDYQKNRKCEKSLLEIHQDKLRKKKLKEEKKTGQTIRRPFDRDIDLRINRFNQNKKNAIINKAQNLNERFSLGKL